MEIKKIKIDRFEFIFVYADNNKASGIVYSNWYSGQFGKYSENKDFTKYYNIAKKLFVLWDDEKHRVGEHGYYNPEKLTIDKISDARKWLNQIFDTCYKLGIGREGVLNRFTELNKLKNKIDELTAEITSVNGYNTKNRKDWVYFIKGNNLYKIGVTCGNPNYRFNSIRTMSPIEILPVYLIPTNKPYELESELHKKFKDKRKQGEWFELSSDDIQIVKDNYNIINWNYNTFSY